MRDTRESRLLLVLLIAIAFALITVDIRGGEESPVDGARRAAATVFGPVENGVAAAVDPVGNAIGAVRDSGARHNRIAELEQQNAALKTELGSDDQNRNRVRELDRMLKKSAAGQYGIKAAEVIAIGAAQGFSWTVTIDAGSNDGIKRDMTVINGDGLVGRITTVGPDTATVLLANDPDFTVGTRMEKTDELGFATGQGSQPLSVQFLNGKAKVKKGDRLVTFGSSKNKPFVPGVPVGEVVRVDPSGGGLTRTVYVRPYVGFTKLDIVGIVVQAPREDPRDMVLPKAPAKPAKPKPTPTVTVTISPNGDIVDTDGNVVGNVSESPDPSGSPNPSGGPNSTPSAGNAVDEQR
ncbi:rod shape-determining protein MreC [Streptomyces sp. Ncost-T10-10d]|uniref:rod shape-determining protein MreC n=1 Tax=Streptomyces sp. Ncost-T10-10d TaxID=1839774 RepID=UPI00081E05FC|nr:rod shape-determining protein MreC [Streptomyces sp. Ncost-T10-10d]SCF83872.1 rod shape-determining protein MreC [Streptomyces sp. Ncost-T10-10d]